jgi:DNA (cytosine-5)-methyltransferase 1
VAAGLRRFVIESPEPFIVSLTHHGSDRVEPLDEPFRTITGAKRGEKALCTPFITKFRTGSVGSALDEPLHTVTAGGEMKRPAGSPHAMGLVAPTLIQTGYGEREGQAPRAPGLDKPLGTVVAGGSKHALVSAFLAKHYGGVVGTELDSPIGTVTATDHHSLVTSNLVKLRGTCRHGQPLTEPMATVSAQGTHLAEVRAFLVAYYGNERDGGALSDPIRTVTSKERFGLVTIYGEEYVIADIGLRMLTARELFRAQGFEDDYIIDPEINGKPLSKTAQIRMCGNSVCPPLAAAMARAQFEGSQKRRAA